MFEKKLKTAIQKYLDADTKNSKSGTKGAITKLINAASATDVMLIPGILQEFQELPSWLKLRFEKGSLYQEGDRVFGWCRDDQIQAVELPVYLGTFSYDDGNENRIVKYIRVRASGEEGFAAPISIPFDGCRVSVKPGDPNFLKLLEYGWASPCDLQWSWFERPCWSALEGYVVERSIIPHGFWHAWKWWPGCWEWYYSHRPELFFEDTALWGDLLPVEPPNNPYAAVLGGANKQYFNDRMFFLDD